MTTMVELWQETPVEDRPQLWDSLFLSDRVDIAVHTTPAFANISFGSKQHDEIYGKLMVLSEEEGMPEDLSGLVGVIRTVLTP